MYLFVLLLILSIIYFIFGRKHDPYGKYFLSYFFKPKSRIYPKFIVKSLYRSCLQHFELQKRRRRKKKKTYSLKEVKGIKINLNFIFQ